VASFFIPKNKRKYIYNIYAFARLADDIADSDSLSPVEKTIKLDKLDKELKDCFENVYNNENNDQLNIFKALHNTAFELNINADEFSNLLKAFKQDAVKQRYDKFEELIEYSNFSANPIGHLVLNTFGYHKENDEELFRFSDNICTGLQLINFWQDVGRDLEINRIYIPFKEMQKFNYSEELLLKKIENDDFKYGVYGFGFQVSIDNPPDLFGVVSAIVIGANIVKGKYTKADIKEARKHFSEKDSRQIIPIEEFPKE